MKKDSWQVNYPAGIIKYIDLFREKYFQYPKFDKILDKYIKKYKKSNGNRVLSLGSGTGRHEVELVKLGYNVTAIEKNKESIEIAKEYARKSNVEINFIEYDFLNNNMANNFMNINEQFDIVLLLLVPISIDDYSVTLDNIKSLIKEGGVFITDVFGYENDVNINESFIESNIEVADDKIGDFAVRLNYYEYDGYLVKWDAVYLYKDISGKLNMDKDRDYLDVIPDEYLDSPLSYDEKEYEILPKHKLVEVDKCINPPHMVEYFVGWRKVRE
ncbi:class I SAM-dependent methyltransferase [Breznakia pachnodae]|uniref:SAM-dependent methyltransferase n=1 Tax=Breznakia pachnodae TaxID=265178 RepID=A0ABU0E3R9_9FIRM|nr:class I SAM-dependent methyltransferase [Breznakia pachnodae]MDQ0361537.1 SAM-dependent methyltransferase [Breznakia pachnodae]